MCAHNILFSQAFFLVWSCVFKSLLRKKAWRGMGIDVYFSFSISYELIGLNACPVYYQPSVTPLPAEPVDQ